jgi:hypothetical protein
MFFPSQFASSPFAVLLVRCQFIQSKPKLAYSEPNILDFPFGQQFCQMMAYIVIGANAASCQKVLKQKIWNLVKN